MPNNPDTAGDVEPTGGESSRKKKLLEEAHARFELASEAESDNRQLALDDLNFIAGEQWPEKVRRDRERDGRPCLVVNRMPQFVRQVTNDQRQNRPSVKVHPVDDKADVATAKIFEGITRHIQYSSDSDAAYDTAFESACKGGWGYFRVVTDYLNHDSFDQEIYIREIRNAMSVFFDPFATKSDGSDAEWAQIVDELSKEEYMRTYPDSKLAQRDEWESIGNQVPDWMPSGSARIAEYFYKEYVEVELALLSDGSSIEMAKIEAAGMLPEGITIVKTRTSQKPVVKWCKLNACEILEETTWPGKWIPIIPVYGAENNINGKRILESVIRHAKDPARMYNYWSSAETEAIALAPRAPFIAAEGQVEDYKDLWESANRRNHAVLPYKPTSVAGVAVPPPQRQAFEPAVGAITNAKLGAADDIKATTGIYDASLGNRSNESSGIAIQRRNQQSQTATFHCVDNLSRSIKHCGRILVDLIPKIYDTPRVARILGEDGTQEIVPVNQPFQKDGQSAIHQLDVGTYDVAIEVGPSYATKRQEAVAGMIETTRAVPKLMDIAGDLMIKNMDWPGAQEIAERMKKMLPPNLIDDGKGQEIPPQVQAQMQQMGQMVESLTAKLHEAQDIRDQKLLELESKERIEMAKLQVQSEIEMAKLGSREGIELLRQEIAEIQGRLTMLKYNEPIEREAEEMPQQPMGPQAQGPEGQGMPPEMGQPPMDQMGQEPTGGLPPGQPMGQPEGMP